MKFSIILLLGLSQLSAAIADLVYYSVDWPVELERNWKDTTAEIQERTGISGYALYKNPDPQSYGYSLEVDIVGGWAKFTGRKYGFTDSAQPPDTYTLLAYRSGRHYVRYNSDMPRITSVGVEW
ncbi:hypothetical protein K457DRAFT_126587 [Linnemannia elongata AG-77]|uniref:Uncharacterized protein n=1 Tax=Linnemannia elongata AG-77 TaxID=1314771 RepID=A0A197JTK2_9FUNG|nr:hypothetical protein K457DRAFT_126587 [Linnemannia elongata AG-77]